MTDTEARDKAQQVIELFLDDSWADIRESEKQYLRDRIAGALMEHGKGEYERGLKAGRLPSTKAPAIHFKDPHEDSPACGMPTDRDDYPMTTNDMELTCGRCRRKYRLEEKA